MPKETAMRKKMKNTGQNSRNQSLHLDSEPLHLDALHLYLLASTFKYVPTWTMLVSKKRKLMAIFSYCFLQKSE